MSLLSQLTEVQRIEAHRRIPPSLSHRAHKICIQNFCTFSSILWKHIIKIREKYATTNRRVRRIHIICILFSIAFVFISFFFFSFVHFILLTWHTATSECFRFNFVGNPHAHLQYIYVCTKEDKLYILRTSRMAWENKEKKNCFITRRFT